MKNEIEEVVAKWDLDNQVRNLSRESLETYRSSTKDFTDYFERKGVRRFKQITGDIVKGYIAEQQERRCGARTINNRLKALRRLCNFYREAVNERYEIPAFVLQREQETDRGPLSNEEVRRLVEGFDPANESSVLVAFILDTGLRSKSVRNIKVENLDLDAGRVVVQVTKNHDVLILPLSIELRSLLGGYLKAHEIRDGYLFRNEKGGKMYDRSSIFKKVNRYMKSCGVNRSGVHLFRYTFGRIMIENNCNAMLLQKWLGHRTMEETKKYVKLYSRELMDICENVTPLSQNGKILKHFQKNS